MKLTCRMCGREFDGAVLDQWCWDCFLEEWSFWGEIWADERRYYLGWPLQSPLLPLPGVQWEYFQVPA